jgi:aryl-alcohol dehydrogenase-like predicted oxidoreductase
VIRSIFLQGLLLMELGEIPPHLVATKAKIQELKSFARDNSLSVLQICLAYANSISWASGIIIGVASLNQLIEIVRNSPSLPKEWESKISTLPQELVDPRKWSL